MINNPAGFELMTYKEVVNALTQRATLLDIDHL